MCSRYTEKGPNWFASWNPNLCCYEAKLLTRTLYQTKFKILNNLNHSKTAEFYCILRNVKSLFPGLFCGIVKGLALVGKCHQLFFSFFFWFSWQNLKECLLWWLQDCIITFYSWFNSTLECETSQWASEVKEIKALFKSGEMKQSIDFIGFVRIK